MRCEGIDPVQSSAALDWTGSIFSTRVHSN
jgi:hypothetical protein